ncbi:MAG TPA: RNA-binding cell elongation regulator Jag/EloR [Candidatus Krumholzibacteria bacterium]|nr:RNA-binding cell elongation regulator Jag/EloR [Candidatus Krumholzibacteria bacterium]
MQSIETSGKTIDQALDKALKELAARKEEVDIEVLEETHSGLRGIFGGKMVRIRVSRRGGPGAPPGVDSASSEVIRKIIAEVLGFMGVDHSITIEESADTTFVNITSSGLDGLLIGRRGETLASIQHVVNRIFTSRTGRHSKITVDVGGYVRRKHRLLVEKAQRLADRVRQTQKEYDFEPLKASERRIIHLAVADYDDVTTYTIGDGLLRKVVISPKTSATDDLPRD